MNIKNIDEAALKSYRDVRAKFLSEKRGPEESPESFIWSTTFSEDGKREFSAYRLGGSTVVYSSEYFPKGLARVIINIRLVMFVHYDGRVVIKNTDCLDTNEKILVDGIKKIDPD